jgi:hypothetical protein
MGIRVVWSDVLSFLAIGGWRWLVAKVPHLKNRSTNCRSFVPEFHRLWEGLGRSVRSVMLVLYSFPGSESRPGGIITPEDVQNNTISSSDLTVEEYYDCCGLNQGNSCDSLYIGDSHEKCLLCKGVKYSWQLVGQVRLRRYVREDLLSPTSIHGGNY